MDIIQKAMASLPQLERLIMTHPGLPHQFVPVSNGYFQEQFYWDSFFIMQGLQHYGPQGKKIIKGMVENFFVMLDECGHIPNSYNSYNTRTQPPFLSSMVKLVHSFTHDKEWLKNSYDKIVQEYKNVWTRKPRLTSIGLSRYHDDQDPHNQEWDISYAAMQESGWDNTLRFGGVVGFNGKYVEGSKVHHCCPVDLNALLYKYELDLAEIQDILGGTKEANEWRKKAESRKQLINDFMWDEEIGLYYDYDYEAEEKMNAKTLAAFFPLWVGLADQKQAEKLKLNLSLFEYGGGLSTTEKCLSHPDMQWGYPNGWVPLHWVIINGLKQYGFDEDASRITHKWLNACADKFVNHGEWGEKICVDPTAQRFDDPRYKHQSDTYWTMGVFADLY